MEKPKPTETTAFGDSWKKYSADPVKKGNVDVYPEQFLFKCGKIEIISGDGTSRTTRILIDGKQANGIYDLHIHFNTRRIPELKLGVYLSMFDFDLMPREKK